MAYGLFCGVRFVGEVLVCVAGSGPAGIIHGFPGHGRLPGVRPLGPLGPL